MGQISGKAFTFIRTQLACHSPRLCSVPATGGFTFSGANPDVVAAPAMAVLTAKMAEAVAADMAAHGSACTRRRKAIR